MSKPNYLQHEDQYRFLRENAHSGWGGESLEQRMLGWKTTADALMASSHFPKCGAQILELGSGAGDSLIPFAEAGYRVTGIEISPTAVNWAQEKFKERKLSGNFVLGNIPDGLPFGGSTFDAVLDAACLHCLIGNDLNRTLVQVSKVLKPSGFFLVSHMVNDPRELSPGMVFNSETRVQEKDGVPYRSMPTLTGLNELLRLAGFEIIHQEIRQNSWWDHAEIWCRRLA